MKEILDIQEQYKLSNAQFNIFLENIDYAKWDIETAIYILISLRPDIKDDEIEQLSFFIEMCRLSSFSNEEFNKLNLIDKVNLVYNNSENINWQENLVPKSFLSSKKVFRGILSIDYFIDIIDIFYSNGNYTITSIKPVEFIQWAENCVTVAVPEILSDWKAKPNIFANLSNYSNIFNKKDNIDPRERTSYLTIIYSLLKSKDIDVRNRDTTGTIKNIIELAGFSLKDAKIKKVRDEIIDLLEKNRLGS